MEEEATPPTTLELRDVLTDSTYGQTRGDGERGRGAVGSTTLYPNPEAGPDGFTGLGIPDTRFLGLSCFALRAVVTSTSSAIREGRIPRPWQLSC